MHAHTHKQTYGYQAEERREEEEAASTSGRL